MTEQRREDKRDECSVWGSVPVISILGWSGPLTKIFHSLSLSLFESQNKPIFNLPQNEKKNKWYFSIVFLCRNVICITIRWSIQYKLTNHMIQWAKLDWGVTQPSWRLAERERGCSGGSAFIFWNFQPSNLTSSLVLITNTFEMFRITSYASLFKELVFSQRAKVPL